MEVSPKEMRKMLNAAWDARKRFYCGPTYITPTPSKARRRYRDVSRILQEAKKKEQRKDGRDDKR